MGTSRGLAKRILCLTLLAATVGSGAAVLGGGAAMAQLRGGLATSYAAVEPPRFIDTRRLSSVMTVRPLNLATLEPGAYGDWVPGTEANR